MTNRRPRIEGYAIVSHEGIARPRLLRLKFRPTRNSIGDRLPRVGDRDRHSAEGGPGRRNAKRIVLTRPSSV